MINNNQFVSNVLTGSGIISNQQNKYCRIWFMKKAYHSILRPSKILKRKDKLKILLMALSINLTTETDLFFLISLQISDLSHFILIQKENFCKQENE